MSRSSWLRVATGARNTHGSFALAACGERVSVRGWSDCCRGCCCRLWRQEHRAGRIPGARVDEGPHQRADGRALDVAGRLVDLVDREGVERVDPAEDQVADGPGRALELARVLDRSGGAGLHAQPAEHAL